MKVALVHDWLNQKAGGAEQVLDQLATIFPEAPIYTMIYNPERFNYPEERIRTSFLQSAPDFLKQRSRYLLPLIPSAIEAWDFSDFDVVISSSCAFSKNIITHEGTIHISYCHSPMRFAWDYWPMYLNEQQVGPLRRAAIRRMVGRLRLWDYAGAARVDHFIANSKTTQARIQKYYRRSSEIVYPPVDSTPHQADKDDYYVTLGMLTPYKKIDLAIEAFNISGKPLKVIGDGPDRTRLEALAAENIEFTGYVTEEERTHLLAKARGLIFPNIEDFGIAPVDAMAAGTAVIAYAAGGATETVIEGQTGIFFTEQTARALNEAVLKAETQEFKLSDLHARADQFSYRQFHDAIIATVERHSDVE
ncbi:MAG: glycosyltransferase [Candidatus Saccharimonadales bacterium]